MTNLFYKLINDISEEEKSQIGEGLNILGLHYKKAFKQIPADLTHILRKIPINQGGGAKRRSKRRSKRRNRKKKSMRGGSAGAVLGAGALLSFFLYYCLMGGKDAHDGFAHDRQTARAAATARLDWGSRVARRPAARSPSPITIVDARAAQERAEGGVLDPPPGPGGWMPFGIV